MPDDTERALAQTRRLPPSALAGLRSAFADEVAERLPRLRDAVASGDPHGLDVAVRDAHTLGSGAAVVGEAGAARAARAAEAGLLARPADLSQVRTHVDDLVRCLAGWAP